MKHIVSSVELSSPMLVMSFFAANTIRSYEAKHSYKLSYALLIANSDIIVESSLQRGTPRNGVKPLLYL